MSETTEQRVERWYNESTPFFTTNERDSMRSTFQQLLPSTLSSILDDKASLMMFFEFAKELRYALVLVTDEETPSDWYLSPKLGNVFRTRMTAIGHAFFAQPVAPLSPYQLVEAIYNLRDASLHGVWLLRARY